MYVHVVITIKVGIRQLAVVQINNLKLHVNAFCPGEAHDNSWLRPISRTQEDWAPTIFPRIAKNALIFKIPRLKPFQNLHKISGRAVALRFSVLVLAVLPLNLLSWYADDAGRVDWNKTWSTKRHRVWYQYW